MKPKLVLIVAILAGLIAFWLTGRYLQHETARIQGSAKRVWVVAAARDLPAGSVLKNSDLGKIEVFQRNVGSRAIEPGDVREIIGKKLLFNINRHDPIQWSDIDAPYKGDLGLAETINPSLRAVAIPVDAVASVSGMIKPNDHVDVLGTFTFPAPTVTGAVETVTLTVLQDVTVLATGSSMARKAPGERSRPGAGYSTITFEVTPREAELLVFAQTVKGRLTLVLRNPTDVSFITDLPAINFEHLHKKLPELNLIRQRDIRHKKDVQ